MNAVNISRVKRVVRQVELSEFKVILDQLMTLATAEEVVTALEKEMYQRYPQVFSEVRI
jgi:phosphoenolpyruvate-protein kinase (PTS system EI component)